MLSSHFEFLIQDFQGCDPNGTFVLLHMLSSNLVEILTLAALDSVVAPCFDSLEVMQLPLLLSRGVCIRLSHFMKI